MSEHLFDLFRLELLADLAPEYLSSDELQTSGRRVFGAGPRAEDPTAAGDTGKSLETVHEGPGHDVYGCDLLRERDALSYGCEAPVGRNREVI